MIVPMKKAAIIMQQKDAEESIRALRSLGVVHVEHQQVPKGKDISLIQDDLALADQVLEVISEEEFVEKYKSRKSLEVVALAKGSQTIVPQLIVKGDFLDWRQAATRIIDLWKRLDHLQEYSRPLRNRLAIGRCGAILTRFR